MYSDQLLKAFHVIVSFPAFPCTVIPKMTGALKANESFPEPSNTLKFPKSRKVIKAGRQAADGVVNSRCCQ